MIDPLFFFLHLMQRDTRPPKEERSSLMIDPLPTPEGPEITTAPPTLAANGMGVLSARSIETVLLRQLLRLQALYAAKETKKKLKKKQLRLQAFYTAKETKSVKRDLIIAKRDQKCQKRPNNSSLALVKRDLL